MARLSPGQIAGLLAEAGWSKAEIPRATAVVLGESGGRPDAIGDVKLQTAKWGPSVGLFQIRSLKAQKGTGGIRDQDANMHPLTNAKHALEIRKQQGWVAWTVFSSGAYLRYIAQATAASLVPIPWRITRGLFPNDATGAWRPTDPLDIPNPFEGLDKVREGLAFLADRKNWTRLGLFLAGFAFILVAIIGVAGAVISSPTGKQVIKGSTKLAVKKGLK